MNNKKQYSTREIAFYIIKTCFKNDQPLQGVIDHFLTDCRLAQRERSFVSNLCYTYCRIKGRNDFLVQSFFRGSSLPGELNLLLGLAITELFYFTKVPVYATVSSYVELTRKFGWQRWIKVVNALLRRIDREFKGAVEELHYFVRKTAGDERRYLSAWYSVPLWLYDLWVKNYAPEQCMAYLEASLRQPPLGVRFNHCLAGWSIEKKQQLEHLLYSGPAGQLVEWEKQGVLTRQSLAVQEIMRTLHAAHWPEPILDLCAGRGGKTTLLLELRRQVWACDRYPRKIAELSKELRRLHLKSGLLFVADSRLLPLKKKAQTVLLDVPCSGLGVLSRRPDIKWKQGQSKITSLLYLQADLLDQGWKVLASGGELVYITCTLNPAENEQQVEKFLQRIGQHQGELLQVWQTPPASQHLEFLFGARIRKGW